MRFCVTKDGRHVEDVNLSHVTFGTRVRLSDGQDAIIWNLHVEQRMGMLVVDWMGHSEKGHTYRGYAIDLMIK